MFIPLHWIDYMYVVFFSARNWNLPGKETCNQNPVSKWQMNSSKIKISTKKKKMECRGDSHEIHVHIRMWILCDYIISFNILILMRNWRRKWRIHLITLMAECMHPCMHRIHTLTFASISVYISATQRILLKPEWNACISSFCNQTAGKTA